MSDDPLQAPLKAIVALVKHQRKAIGDSLEHARDAATSPSELAQTLRGGAAELDRLAEAADAAVRPVRDELTQASGKVRSDLDEAIKVAREYCAVASTLPTAGVAVREDAVQVWLPYVLGENRDAFKASPQLDLNVLQQWLARQQLKIDKLWAGTAQNTEYDYTSGSGITSEVRRAVVLRRGERPERDRNAIRREGEYWQLTFGAERGGYPTLNALEWLAALLGSPNRPYTVADLRGDPEGKLAGDARLRGERETDAEGVRAIQKKLEDIEAVAAETGWTEAAENEKADLLARLEAADDGKRLADPLRTAHHAVATQFRNLRRRLREDMPELAAHLTAALKLDFPHFGYFPPAGTPAWES
jgi:hypothetical protein